MSTRFKIQIHGKRPNQKGKLYSLGKRELLAHIGLTHRSLGVYFLVHRSSGPLRWPTVCSVCSNFGRVTNHKSEASPYLHSLGLGKAAASLVFMAGPLSGLVVQPLVGALADRTRSRYGRRRPFMLIGSMACAASMLVLSWARELSGVFGGVGLEIISCLRSDSVP
jgi:MFS family permease